MNILLNYVLELCVISLTSPHKTRILEGAHYQPVAEMVSNPRKYTILSRQDDGEENRLIYPKMQFFDVYNLSRRFTFIKLYCGLLVF